MTREDECPEFYTFLNPAGDGDDLVIQYRHFEFFQK